MKCLITEDDFISSRILREMLSKIFDCDSAETGEEAITSFRRAHEDKHPYDLIFMDIMLPGIDGHEAVRCIRDMEKELEVAEVRIIMTSALNDPAVVSQADNLGRVTSYIVKPVGVQALMRELRLLGFIS